MRILHLVKPVSMLAPPWFARAAADGSDAAVGACAAFVRAARDLDHTVVSLGGTAAHARALALGLRPDLRIAPLLGLPRAAARALRRYVDQSDDVGCIIVWGRGAHAGVPLMAPVVEFDVDTGVMSRGGADAATVAPAPGLIAAPDRHAVRRRLGVADDELLIGLIDDPPRRADAVDGVTICSILQVAGRRVVAAVMRGSPGLARVRRHDRIGGYVHRVCTLDGPAVALGPAFDLAFALGDSASHPPTFATRLIAAELAHAGVPVVMPDSPEARAVEGVATAASRHAAAMAKACLAILDSGPPAHRPAPPTDRLGAELVRAWRSLTS